MFRKLFSTVIVLFSLCMLLGTVVASNASCLAARAYFGLNGVPLLYIQTSVGLTNNQFNPGQYLSVYNGQMNTSTKYMSSGNVQTVYGTTATVVTATTLGYGYKLPYLTFILPSDLVKVTYIITIPTNGSKPTLSITVSSYDHPTLPAFYQANLALVSGGVVVLQ